MNTNLIVNEILNKIKFKIGPNQNIRKEYLYRIKKRIFKLINKENNFINSNTTFSNINEKDLVAIKELEKIDTMSKISIGFIVNQICKNLSPKNVYLNIGVWRGFSMFAGMINTSCEVHGVDNFSFDYEDGNKPFDNREEEKKTRDYFFKNFAYFKKDEKHFFYDIDYKVFFKEWEKKNKLINFYYYDGEHSYENQYENLIIARNFLSKGSIILVDDYNEDAVEGATMDFVSKYNSEFNVIKELKTANKYIHPTYANGIILVEKNN